MCGHTRRLRGWTDGRRWSGGRHVRQAANADRMRDGIKGSGGGGQAKIAMSRQGRGFRGRTDGRAGTGNPAALSVTACIIYVCCLLASPVCLDFIAGSRWLVVGLDNGTVVVSL